MGEKRFIISDAAKLVDVESHVLRYWEEELGIEIPRNEMGHRYYEEGHISLLKNVKELKDCGYQLKAIKMLVPELLEMQKDENGNLDALKRELFSKIARVSMEMGPASELEAERESGTVLEAEKIEVQPELSVLDDNGIAGKGETAVRSEEEVSGRDEIVVAGNSESIHNKSIGEATTPLNGSKLEQFQMILSEVVSNVLKENTGEFGKEVSDIVSDNVLKEMDYLMHIREKQEEERFRRLDETIRSYQTSRKETSKQNHWLLTKLRKNKNAGCE